MAGFVVRPGTQDDIEARVDLYIAVAAEGRWIAGELPLDRDELLAKRRESFDSERFRGWVAISGDELIGDLGLFLFKGARADVGMAVAADWRGRGVGSALMRAAIDWARAEELDKIFLEVWPHNEAAIALYAAFGFEREGYHPKHYRRKNGEAWDAISMGLVLDRSASSEPDGYLKARRGPPGSQRWPTKEAGAT